MQTLKAIYGLKQSPRAWSETEARAYRFQLLFSEWIPFRLKFPLLAVEWPVESNEAKERDRYSQIVEDELFRRYPLVAHV